MIHNAIVKPLQSANKPAAFGSALRNGFVPSDLTNLSVWLDAAQGATTDGATQFTIASSQYMSNSSNPQTAFSAQNTTLSGCAWIYVDTINTGSHQAICGRTASNSDTQHDWQVQVTNSNSRIHLVTRITGNNVTCETAVNSVNASTWYFVAWSIDTTGGQQTLKVWLGSTASLGAAVTATSASPQTSASTDPQFRIGARMNATGQFFGGRIDSLGIWQGRLLSQSDVEYLYNSGAGRTYADLNSAIKTSMSAWYDLDAADGTDSHGSLLLVPANTPTQVAGIAAGMATDGDPVKSWAGRGGNLTVSQSTHASKPLFKTGVLNGFPVVRFDGVDDAMAGDLGSNYSQPNTIFIVNKGYIITGGNIIDGTTASFRHRIVYTSSNRYILASNSAVTSSVGVTNTNWRVITAQYNSPSSIMRVDGVEVVSPSDTGAAGLGGMTIGAAQGAASSYCQQDVAEIIVYNRALSTAEIKQVEAYLSQKYNIAVTS